LAETLAPLFTKTSKIVRALHRVNFFGLLENWLTSVKYMKIFKLLVHYGTISV
jgi:hypothetical protein